jgi:hypothetical protein
MKGRLFKFKLETEPINGNIDNFLNNIVSKRENKEIYLPNGRVAINSINENDYIFIQSNGYINHYMKCNEKGPTKKDENEVEISVKEIKKFNKPIKSTYKGQGFNILNESNIKELLNNNNVNNDNNDNNDNDDKNSNIVDELNKVIFNNREILILKHRKIIKDIINDYFSNNSIKRDDIVLDLFVKTYMDEITKKFNKKC